MKILWIFFICRVFGFHIPAEFVCWDYTPFHTTCDRCGAKMKQVADGTWEEYQ